MIYDSILDTIGETPIVRLNRVIGESPHRFFAKIEYFNPGQSVKDRVALAFVEEAEKRGDLRPGGTLVEATSGNTGLGLALVAAVKGYKCVFVMPEKISQEKRDILKAFGAKVVMTPLGLDHDDPRSYLAVSKRIAEETPNSFYVNQYNNPDNPNRHYKTTGPEIWTQMAGSLDVFVGGAGTGGTISGTGRYLKERKPALKVVCIDPVGSILHDIYFHQKIIDPPQPYKVEGVGDDMVPENVHFSVIDDFIKVDDSRAFAMTRRLISEEGLCVGPSSAMTLVGAMDYSKKLNQPSNILVLMPDHGRAYLSKSFSDHWLKENQVWTRDFESNEFAEIISAEEYFLKKEKR